MNQDFHLISQRPPEEATLHEEKETRKLLPGDESVRSVVADWQKQSETASSKRDKIDFTAKKSDLEHDQTEDSATEDAASDPKALAPLSAGPASPVETALETNMDELTPPKMTAEEEAEHVRIVERLLKEKAAELEASGSAVRARVITEHETGFMFVLGRALGSGGFGEVFEARDPRHSEEEVVKMAKRPGDESLAREFSILQKVNRDRLPGLQLPPRRFVQLNRESAAPQTGYLAPRYSASMHHMRLETSPAIQQVMYQLTSGLQTLHAAEIYHGDIKPENMLHMPQRFDLADLGGAQEKALIQQFIEELLDKDGEDDAFEVAISKIWHVSTPHYIEANDITLLRFLLGSYVKNWSEDRSQRSSIVQDATSAIFLAMQARDVYALGFSLKELCLEPTTPVKHAAPRDHSFFATEGFARGTQIYRCLTQMTNSTESINPKDILSMYANRLKAMANLHALMAPTKSTEEVVS